MKILFKLFMVVQCSIIVVQSIRCVRDYRPPGWRVCSVPETYKNDVKPTDNCRCHNIVVDGEGDSDCKSEENGEKWCYIYGDLSNCKDKVKVNLTEISQLRTVTFVLDFLTDKSYYPIYKSFDACKASFEIEDLGNEVDFLDNTELIGIDNPIEPLVEELTDGPLVRAKSPQDCYEKCFAQFGTCAAWTFIRSVNGNDNLCVLKSYDVCHSQDLGQTYNRMAVSGFICRSQASNGCACWSKDGIFPQEDEEHYLPCGIAGADPTGTQFQKPTGIFGALKAKGRFRRRYFKFINGKWRFGNFVDRDNDQTDNAGTSAPFIDATETETDTDCYTTSGSPTPNQECMFPFRFKGILRTMCINESDPDGKFWCSTKTDFRDNHIQGQGHWGFCRVECLKKQTEKLSAIVKNALESDFESTWGKETDFDGELTEFGLATGNCSVTLVNELGETVIMEGHFEAGKMHGYGVMENQETRLSYAGDWSDGHWNGIGSRTDPAGHEYKGEFKDSLRHGQGTQTFKGCDKTNPKLSGPRECIGTWVGDQLVDGNCTYCSGASYKGPFLAGYRHGLGVFHRSNGDIFTGTLTFDNQFGFGRYQRVDGTVYDGQFREGWEDGLGRISYSGTSYEGEEEHGWHYVNYSWALQPLVVYSKADYFGQVLHGQPEGIGHLVYENNGPVLMGNFSEGVYIDRK